ncbi:hypothetical protein HZH68_000674 [Vespula germanica]|uniref:Uncharacterized protein n=1 Tax=Vespula germanica TaxID=30212 RepID=A0A834U628_VESGE|nr:hypothetical protein HZH68_000674 [Vespula germanica]
MQIPIVLDDDENDEDDEDDNDDNDDNDDDDDDDDDDDTIQRYIPYRREYVRSEKFLRKYLKTGSSQEECLFATGSSSRVSTTTTKTTKRIYIKDEKDENDNDNGYIENKDKE